MFLHKNYVIFTRGFDVYDKETNSWLINYEKDTDEEQKEYVISNSDTFNYNVVPIFF